MNDETLKCANQDLAWNGPLLTGTVYCQADSVTTRAVRRCGRPPRVTPFCQEHADRHDRFVSWLDAQVTKAREKARARRW